VPGGTIASSAPASSDSRQDRAGDQPAPPAARRGAIQHHCILARQADRGGQPGHHAEASPAGPFLDCAIAVLEQRRIAAELVDEEAADHRRVPGVDHGAGADDRGDHAAPVDIADQHDRHSGGAREAHVRDVAGAQVDLGRRAGAFDHHQVACGLEPAIARQHLGKQGAARLAEIARAERAAHPAVHDQLRRAIGLGLEQYRVHVGMRFHAAGDRLQRLGAADLAAVRGHRGIVRHVLRLERTHRQPAIGEGPAEPGDQHRLANVRSGALEHQSAHATLPAISQSSRQAPA
jgi:hypothetical protein